MKKVLTSILVLSLVLLMGVSAFASNKVEVAGSGGCVPVELEADAATFNVTVPTSLPLTVDSDGEVSVANDVKIINNGHGAVIVTNVEVEGKNDWIIVNFDNAEMHKEKVGTKKVALVINDAKTTGEDEIDFEGGNFPVMEGNAGDNELVIVYGAKVPAQASALNDVTVADVIFTIDWDAVEEVEED